MKPKHPDFQEVNLNDILEKKIQFWESQKLEDRKIRIIRRFNRDIPPLYLDREQIGEISYNILMWYGYIPYFDFRTYFKVLFRNR